MSVKTPISQPTENAALPDSKPHTDAFGDLGSVRPDLEEVHARHAITLDAARPAAVARRRKTHQRTARENIEDI
jgi:hypothetical protein